MSFAFTHAQMVKIRTFFFFFGKLKHNFLPFSFSLLFPLSSLSCSLSPTPPVPPYAVSSTTCPIGRWVRPGIWHGDKVWIITQNCKILTACFGRLHEFALSYRNVWWLMLKLCSSPTSQGENSLPGCRFDDFTRHTMRSPPSVAKSRLWRRKG